MMEEQVILVNAQDEQIGTMPKMEAHEKAVLHRAFSVFIFNAQNELMLQQRAAHKYHSPLLWTNTCCSHQRVGESNLEAGTRRLQEEMGFVTPSKKPLGLFTKRLLTMGSPNTNWTTLWWAITKRHPSSIPKKWKPGNGCLWKPSKPISNSSQHCTPNGLKSYLKNFTNI